VSAGAARDDGRMSREKIERFAALAENPNGPLHRFALARACLAAGDFRGGRGPSRTAAEPTGWFGRHRAAAASSS
jgi:hypothetical protein